MKVSIGFALFLLLSITQASGTDSIKIPTSATLFDSFLTGAGAIVGSTTQSPGLTNKLKEEGLNFFQPAYNYLNDKLYPAEKNKIYFDRIWDWIKFLPVKFWNVLKGFTT